MKTLRRVGILLAIALLGVGAYVYSQKSHTTKTEPPTTYQTFKVHPTTTISEPAGTLTLHFTGTGKVVVAFEASTDKGYFSLECIGRSEAINIPGNGVRKATSCRLLAVHYSDNSVDTGEIILKPKR